MSNKVYIAVVIWFVVQSFCFAQVGYQKDSLQIKVYTEIKYKNHKAVQVTLKKVFCDYCSENQKRLIGEEAIRRTSQDLYNPKYVSANDKARLALFIRVAKKDFAKLKDDDNHN